MKLICSILLGLVLTSTGLAMQEGSAKKSEQELIEAENRLSNALTKQDAKELDRLWSDDLVFTFPDGTVTTKAHRLTDLKPRPQLESLVSSNDEVRVYLHGSAAVVTVLSSWKGTVNSQEYNQQYQATHVWKKQGGSWRLIAAHVSQVKK